MRDSINCKNLFYFYVQELGLATAYEQDDGTHRLIRKLLALPFLPDKEIPAAFIQLRGTATTDSLKKLVRYLKSTWIESSIFPPKAWSVYGQAVRTNNNLEGWHNGLNRRAGGKVHIPFYILVQHLHKEAKLCALQIIRLVSDGKLMRIQRQTYRRLQGKIFELWDQYASKDKTAELLLRACSQLYGPVRSS